MSLFARMRRASGAHAGAVAGLFAALPLCVSSASAVVFEPYNIAVLRGLDKVSARVSTLEAPVGATVRFGTLDIVAETCRKPPPEERREAAAYLTIRETRPEQPQSELFSGWMFASSPALSAMDHAVYDVWVLDCVNSASTAESTSASDSSE